jgi:hypothetical protein
MTVCRQAELDQLARALAALLAAWWRQCSRSKAPQALPLEQDLCNLGEER